MEELKACPCGETPKSLLIVDNGSKWAYVCGNCCNEWHIEFRTMYHPIESEDCMKLAMEAWNHAKRGAAQQSTEAVCTCISFGSDTAHPGVIMGDCPIHGTDKR